MRLSKLIGERYKEQPSEALLQSHIFMMRGGYIRQVTNGIYSLLPPAKRIIMKIENILRQEMDTIEGQEVLFPVVMNRELWEESGRYDSIASELVRFKDRSGHDMLLGMTHEEAAVHLARSEVKSHVKYPFMVYQIQTKFRDEARSRGGLIRVREFTMKDAYSFHTSQKCLEEYYEKAYKAYEKIFARVGLKGSFAVESDSGMMGGSISHEFMQVSDTGEDTVVICSECDYRSNMEVAESVFVQEPAHIVFDEIGEVHTPGTPAIEDVGNFLKVPVAQLVKAVVYKADNSDKPVIVFLRGDYEANEPKIQKALGAAITIATNENLPNAEICYGYIGMVGLDTSKCTVLYDKSLEGMTDFVCGGNKKDYHTKAKNLADYTKDAGYHDLSKVRHDDTCAKCGKGRLELKRAIEVGNIFQLGTKYTDKMNMRYTDTDGALKIPIMGCYGIGVGRLMASVLEVHHDDRGPIWPMSIAPWQIHICALRVDDDQVKEQAEGLYNSLIDAGYEVIYDDRPDSPGAKFADADLLGVPVRVVVSPKNLKNDECEISTRNGKVKTMVKTSDIYDTISQIITEL